MLFSEHSDNISLAKVVQLSCIFMRISPALAKAVYGGTCIAVKSLAPPQIAQMQNLWHKYVVVSSSEYHGLFS